MHHLTRRGTGRLFALAAPLLALAIHQAQAGEVEVLHWWTSGGEAKSAAVLKEMLEKQGHSWKDFAVAGGGGESAMTVLKTRAVSGNPPAAAQIKGHDIQEWAALGFLTSLDDTATAGGWDKVLPPVVTKVMKADGHYVAVPVNVHRVNWLWANPAVFAKAGASIPTNWDEFVAAADKIQAAGLIPLAHGGQPWQDATIFDSAVLATGGPELYTKAFIDLDPAALNSPEMVQAFDKMTQLRGFVDDNFSGRDWNLASAMVINNEAAFQIMGDWAKGEFLNAGKVPGTDFLCFRVPGTAGVVTFNSDEFVMFKQSDDAAKQAQNAMASAIESPEFQIAFNKVKGSVPARTDVPDTDFDDCGKKGMAQLKEASEKGTLLGSMAHGHANPAAVKNAIYDVVTAHFNGEYDSTQAAEELANAVEAAQ